MNGIYRKDLIQIQKSWLVELVICAAAVAIMACFEVFPGLITFFAVFWMMQAASTIFADRTSGWYLYSTSFPCTRKQMLQSKYWLALLFGLLGFGLGLLIALTGSKLDGTGFSLASEAVQINIAIAGVITFSAAAFVIPLSYLMKKNQYFMAIVLSFVPAAVMIMFWSSQIQETIVQISETVQAAEVTMNIGLIWGFCLLSILLFILSMVIMPSYISKKDQ